MRFLPYLLTCITIFVVFFYLPECRSEERILASDGYTATCKVIRETERTTINDGVPYVDTEIVVEIEITDPTGSSIGKLEIFDHMPVLMARDADFSIAIVSYGMTSKNANSIYITKRAIQNNKLQDAEIDGPVSEALLRNICIAMTSSDSVSPGQKALLLSRLILSVLDGDLELFKDVLLGCFPDGIERTLFLHDFKSEKMVNSRMYEGFFDRLSKLKNDAQRALIQALPPTAMRALVVQRKSWGNGETLLMYYISKYQPSLVQKYLETFKDIKTSEFTYEKNYLDMLHCFETCQRLKDESDLAPQD